MTRRDELILRIARAIDAHAYNNSHWREFTARRGWAWHTAVGFVEDAEEIMVSEVLDRYEDQAGGDSEE